MKQSKWRIMIGILVLLALVGIGRPRKVEAAAFKPAKTYYLDITSYAKKNGKTVSELIGNYDIEIESVKSSNPSVLKPKKGEYVYFVLPRKNGSAKLTVTYTAGSGKKKTFTTTVKTRTYQNPVKQFKIGSTSFTKKFAKMGECQYDNRYQDSFAATGCLYDDVPNAKKYVKGKLNVKPAGGWKIVKLQKFDAKKSKWSTLKNGKNYTFKCASDRLVVTLKHTKSGYIRTLTVLEMG